MGKSENITTQRTKLNKYSKQCIASNEHKKPLQNELLFDVNRQRPTF